MTDNSVSLVLDKIYKSFSKKRILNGFSHSFSSGCYALIGPNGAGKSTLLSLISGSETLDSGRIAIATPIYSLNRLQQKN